VLHGDFGTSITTRRTIRVEVFKRLPATIYLAVTSVIVSLLIAIPLSTVAAVKRRSLVDYTATATALLGVSIPEFWFAQFLAVCRTSKVGSMSTRRHGRGSRLCRR
jgi:ABC-type dipeptide/oligopeptide/nickel transport system permease component